VAAGRDSWNHNLNAWLINVAALLAVLVATVCLAYAVLLAQLRVVQPNSAKARR
jgi:P pilus assembly chaperone PapD